MKTVDPYKILGAKRTDSDELLKRRYKNLLLKFHPDHYSDKMESLYKTNIIIRAYKAIIKEKEYIRYLNSINKNSYKLEENKLEFFLKYQDKSFLSLFEQNSQIYSIILKKDDFSKVLRYEVSIHYFKIEKDFKKAYKNFVFLDKIIIKDSKKIILKEAGDFYNNNYKTLIIFLNIK